MNLHLDWCSYEAAKYACTNWHYSGTMPCSKINKIGVWENDIYIGCILYSYGANNNIGSPYGLTQQDVVELTRIALNNHVSAVSRMVAISLKLLKRKNPGLKLVVSYADVDQNHDGGIYKAGNWIYEGLKNKGDVQVLLLTTK